MRTKLRCYSIFLIWQDRGWMNNTGALSVCHSSFASSANQVAGIGTLFPKPGFHQPLFGALGGSAEFFVGQGIQEPVGFRFGEVGRIMQGTSPIFLNQVWVGAMLQ